MRLLLDGGVPLPTIRRAVDRLGGEHPLASGLHRLPRTPGSSPATSPSEHVEQRGYTFGYVIMRQDGPLPSGRGPFVQV